MKRLYGSGRHRTKGAGARRDRSGSKKGLALARYDRVTLLMSCFVLFAFLVTARLFVVQVLDHPIYAALASDQHELVQKLMPERGEIYATDRTAPDGIALIATNRTLQHVYANPKQILDTKSGTDPKTVADAIAPILGMENAVVLERVSKEDDSYEPLKHQVTDQEVEALEKAIEEKKLAGIHWMPEEARYYPEGKTVGSLTGFVGYVEEKRQGQYGLEGYFDEELSGTEGSLSTELDTTGRFIAVGDKSIVEAQDGDSLILTIDKNIQYKACELISQAVEQHRANQGSVIVMDPETGKILAMCNAPLYDPNEYGEVEDIQMFMNDIVSDQYEPGSVFKALSMAAAINEGAVTPYSTYDDTGEVIVGPYKIHNSDGKANGVVDMTKVLEDSLNTGAIYVVQKIGDAKWHEYVRNFGFGSYTGVQISGELPGDISSVAKEREIYSATSSYGQGLTVTPIQMLQAFSALANDGMMMKPYLVDRIIKPNGFQEVNEPVVAGQPIGADTARTVSAMLVRVVEEGHSQRAAIAGYHIAGKTGTAQIPRENGIGYDANRHKDTFIGYGPVTDPKFLMLVKMDEPKDVMWAEGSVAPVFADLGKYLVNYLQLPPDKAE